MLAHPFVNATDDAVPSPVKVTNLDRFAFTFQKSGAGTCTLTFQWKIEGGEYDTIPKDGCETGQAFGLLAGDNIGMVTVENPGVDYVRPVITSTAGAVDVSVQMGGMEQ